MKKFISLFISAFVCLSLTACDLTADDMHNIIDIIMNEETPENDIVNDEVIENNEEENEVIEEYTIEDEEEVIINDPVTSTHEFLQGIVEYYNYEDPDFDAHYDYYESDIYFCLTINDVNYSYDDYFFDASFNTEETYAAIEELRVTLNDTIVSEIRSLGFYGAVDIVFKSNDGIDIFLFRASTNSDDIDLVEDYITGFDDYDNGVSFPEDNVTTKGDYYVYPVANTCYWDNNSEYVYIGTITFYDPMTGIYGAMGHYSEGVSNNSVVYEALVREISVVTDEDDSYQAITDIEYVDNIMYGNMFYNGNYGIYGNYTNGGGWIDEYVRVGWKEEVHTGPAMIYSEAPNMSDDVIYAYSIEIVAVYDDYFDFIINDSYMLEVGVGISQGMSGSPVMQDGNIIGALSGLYCSESDMETYGYAVYVEDMLYESGILQ